MAVGSSKRAILLDRDGVLNEDRVDFVKSLDELVILPGTGHAVAALNDAGYTVLVVSNQSCVARGILTTDEVAAINDALRQRLARYAATIDGFYICPHDQDDRCDCRKPAPGLLLQAAQDWEFDLAETWLVGDAPRDIEAGRAAGCPTALVLTGKGRRSRPQLPDIPAFEDLAAFVRWLLAGDVA